MFKHLTVADVSGIISAAETLNAKHHGREMGTRGSDYSVAGLIAFEQDQKLLVQKVWDSIREAETKGVPWYVDEAKPKAKHLPRPRTASPSSVPLQRRRYGFCCSPVVAFGKSCTLSGSR
jgi:hypothetical protein